MVFLWFSHVKLITILTKDFPQTHLSPRDGPDQTKWPHSTPRCQPRSTTCGARVERLERAGLGTVDIWGVLAGGIPTPQYKGHLGLLYLLYLMIPNIWRKKHMVQSPPTTLMYPNLGSVSGLRILRFWYGWAELNPLMTRIAPSSSWWKLFLMV